MPAERPSRMHEPPFGPGPAGRIEDPGYGRDPSVSDGELRSELFEELIDDLIEMHVDWRQECIRLRYAYGRWLSVPAEERDLAFAGYRAALDREEQVSAAYAKRIERIRSRAVR